MYTYACDLYLLCVYVCTYASSHVLHTQTQTHTYSFFLFSSICLSLSVSVCVCRSLSLSLILSLSVRLSHSVPWTQTNRKMHMVECVTMNRRIPKTLDRGSKLCHIATFCGLGILTISDGVFLEASRLSFMKPNG